MNLPSVKPPWRRACVMSGAELKMSKRPLKRSQTVTLVVLLLLMGLFYYLQWPTRVRPLPAPEVSVHLPVADMTVWFERAPDRTQQLAASGLSGPVQATNWQANRSGINMLVQELVYPAGVLESRVETVFEEALQADLQGFGGELILLEPVNSSSAQRMEYRLHDAASGRYYAGVLMARPPALVKMGWVFSDVERLPRVQAMIEKLN